MTRFLFIIALAAAVVPPPLAVAGPLRRHQRLRERPAPYELALVGLG